MVYSLVAWGEGYAEPWGMGINTLIWSFVREMMRLSGFNDLAGGNRKGGRARTVDWFVRLGSAGWGKFVLPPL